MMLEALTPPARGFPIEEFEQRLARAQSFMELNQLDALLVTSPQQVRYFTGFESQLWESPTRSWYVVLPAGGDRPVAVIPEVGATGMASTWIQDIRTWPAPVPADDGITLLSDALREIAGVGGRVGAEFGREVHLRMPINELDMLRQKSDVILVDGTDVIRRCRHVKSEYEIAKLRYVCQLASASFAEVPEMLQQEHTEISLAREFRNNISARGADSTPYLVAIAGKGGYENIVMSPTDRAIGRGDVLIIDTGATYDGYFCDFDRNWAIGNVDSEVVRAYESVWAATEAGIATAVPGATSSDVWRAIADVLEGAGSLGNSSGRFGHGLGMQLTEPPSNIEGDATVLAEGTVLTIEPAMEFSPGRLMVHEENIVVRAGGAELLSVRAAPQIQVLPAN